MLIGESHSQQIVGIRLNIELDSVEIDLDSLSQCWDSVEIDLDSLSQCWDSVEIDLDSLSQCWTQ